MEQILKWAQSALNCLGYMKKEDCKLLLKANLCLKHANHACKRSWLPSSLQRCSGSVLEMECSYKGFGLKPGINILYNQRRKTSFWKPVARRDRLDRPTDTFNKIVTISNRCMRYQGLVVFIANEIIYWELSLKNAMRSSS